jgi:hypothetical protein
MRKKTEINGRRGSVALITRRPSSKKFALTFVDNWRRSDGIVRLRIKAHGVCLFLFVVYLFAVRVSVVGWCSMLQVGRSRATALTNYFNLNKPSSRTMAQGFFLPLIEMSARGCFWGQSVAKAWGWQLYLHLWDKWLHNARTPISHNPVGLHGQSQGHLALLYLGTGTARSAIVWAKGLKFSRRRLWRILSSGMWRLVTLVRTDASQGFFATYYRCWLLLMFFLAGCLLLPWWYGDKFLRIFNSYKSHTASQPRRRNSL